MDSGSGKRKGRPGAPPRAGRSGHAQGKEKKKEKSAHTPLFPERLFPGSPPRLGIAKFKASLAIHLAFTTHFHESEGAQSAA